MKIGIIQSFFGKSCYRTNANTVLNSITPSAHYLALKRFNIPVCLPHISQKLIAPLWMAWNIAVSRRCSLRLSSRCASALWGRGFCSSWTYRETVTRDASGERCQRSFSFYVEVNDTLHWSCLHWLQQSGDDWQSWSWGTFPYVCRTVLSVLLWSALTPQVLQAELHGITGDTGSTLISI